MSSRIWLSLAASITVLGGCATHQENPNYVYSTKYKGGSSTTVASSASSYIQSMPASYQNGSATSYAIAADGSYSRLDQACLRKEKNHELVGASLGGALGAFAGKELIGGTKGTVIGAGLGGAAGYGIGDKTVQCDRQNFVMESSQPIQAPVYPSQSVHSQAVVQSSQAVPVNHQSDIVYQSPRIPAPTDTQFTNISEDGTPGYQVLQAQVVANEFPQTMQVSQPQRLAQSSLSAAQPIDYDYSENVVHASGFTQPSFSETRSIGGFQNGHRVREGDTVYSLARVNCVGVDDIKSLNGLDNNFSIKIGDDLRLPQSRC